jgi:hypothetical protein
MNFGHKSRYWHYSHNAEIMFGLFDNCAAKNILELEGWILGEMFWGDRFVFNNSFDDKHMFLLVSQTLDFPIGDWCSFIYSILLCQSSELLTFIRTKTVLNIPGFNKVNNSDHNSTRGTT